jgi:hypothetical protein
MADGPFVVLSSGELVRAISKDAGKIGDVVDPKKRAARQLLY